MLAEKQKELFYQANKLRNGLGKIDEARASVEDMSVDLEKAQAKGNSLTAKTQFTFTIIIIIIITNLYIFSYGDSADL